MLGRPTSSAMLYLCLTNNAHALLVHVLTVRPRHHGHSHLRPVDIVAIIVYDRRLICMTLSLLSLNPLSRNIHAFSLPYQSGEGDGQVFYNPADVMVKATKSSMFLQAH
jgi:hypothetical protein